MEVSNMGDREQGTDLQTQGATYRSLGSWSPGGKKYLYKLWISFCLSVGSLFFRARDILITIEVLIVAELVNLRCGDLLRKKQLFYS